MSRWVVSFQSHGFHSSWENLLKKIDLIDEKDITDKESLIELSRLKKVIEYIDKYLKLIDPDINITNFIQNLNNFNQYIVNTTSELNNYNSNKSITYLQRANNNIDNCLNTLTSFHTVLPKISGQSIASMLKKYNETLNNALSEINLPSTISSSKEIRNLKKQLLDGVDGENSIADKINTMLNDTEEKYKQLLDYYNLTLNDKEHDNTVKENIETAKDEVENFLKQVKDDMSELSTKIENFEKYYVKVFGDLDEEKNRVGGIKNELEKRIKHLDDFETKQQTKYTTLISEIESLLPSATSVGLAEAYNQERVKFKWPVRIWNGVFILSLITMFFVSYSTLKELNDLKDIGNHILQTLPIIIPLVWLAIFASKRRSENQRLEQEYAHKEALAKSYSSYKKQIEELNKNDQELLVKLLNSAIETISNNASHSLDKKHGDSTPIGELTKSLIEEIKKIRS